MREPQALPLWDLFGPPEAETEPTKVPKMSADQVIDGLEKRYPLNEWAFIREVASGTGWITNRLDVWSIHFWSPGEIIAFEVKVSRSDFKHELEQPEKRAFALSASTRFYFATPAKLVRPEEVPAECGLIWVYEDGRTSTRKAAPERTTERPNWAFVCALLRHQRREDYRQGPGHKGQCKGGGGYYTKEKKSLTMLDGSPYEFTDDVWHAGDPETFCGKEAGHMGYCDRLKRGSA
jgi:hypothetical protein